MKNKKKNYISNKGQNSLESLLLIGGGVLVGIIVLVLLINSTSSSKSVVDESGGNIQELQDDLSIPPKIMDVKPIDCEPGEIGTFNLTWEPVTNVSNSGMYKLVVKDLKGKALNVAPEILTKDNLNPFITVDLSSSESSGVCTDTYQVKAQLIKVNDGKSVSSNTKNISWYKDTDPFISKIDNPENNATFYKENNSSQIIYFSSDIKNQQDPVDCNWYINNTEKSSECQFTENVNNLDTGENYIKLISKDNTNKTFEDSIKINISNFDSSNFHINSIEQPLENDNYNYGTPIHFKINYDNNVGNVSCKWKSSIDSEFGQTNSCDFSYSHLSSGNHTICVYAEDSEGNKDSACVYNILINNQNGGNGGNGGSDFTASISNPTILNYTFGEYIHFSVNYENNSGPVSCSWDSNISGIFESTSCNFDYNDLAVGSHNITLTANDGSDIVTDNIQIDITNSEELEFELVKDLGTLGSVNSFVEFQGGIYAEILINNKSKIYRSLDNGLTWNLVKSFSEGNLQQYVMRSLVVFNNKIYSFVNNKVYSSNDGVDWSVVFNCPDESAQFTDLYVFNGNLYVGTYGWFYNEIYKTSNGTDWVEVFNGDMIMTTLTMGFVEFNNSLFVGINNLIYKSVDGVNFNEVANLDGDMLYSYVFDNKLYFANENKVYKTIDGVNFNPVYWVSFPNTIKSLATFDNYIYLGTETNNDGKNLVRSPDGVNWSDVNSEDNTDIINTLYDFNNHFYLGTKSNNSFGIYRSN